MVWSASACSPRRISSITLPQTAENPAIATSEHHISILADIGRWLV